MIGTMWLLVIWLAYALLLSMQDRADARIEELERKIDAARLASAALRELGYASVAGSVNVQDMHISRASDIIMEMSPCDNAGGG